MSKIIFLDVDGVLNDINTKEIIAGYIFVDDEKLDRLAKIVHLTGAEIVLSSTWRFDWGSETKSEIGTPLYALRKCLEKRNVYILDKTQLIINIKGNADLRGSREKEIKLWLSQHPEVEKYIILDDMDYLFHSKDILEQHLILTDEATGGLTEELTQQAITMLSD